MLTKVDRQVIEPFKGGMLKGNVGAGGEVRTQRFYKHLPSLLSALTLQPTSLIL